MQNQPRQCPACRRPAADREPTQGLRAAFCLVLLLLTLFAPALQAGMLEIHRATRHGNAFAGPTALQNLTSMARHSAPAEGRVVAGEHANAGGHQTGWIRVVDAAAESKSEAAHDHDGAADHSHPHSSVEDRHVHPDEPADPSRPHRHGDRVHTHEQGQEQLEMLAASLLKLFLDSSVLALPVVTFVADAAPAASLTGPEIIRPIDIPPPRVISV